MKYNKFGIAIRFCLAIAIMWGIPAMVFSFFNFYGRLKIEVEGRIIERQVGYHYTPPSGPPARRFADYKILQKDGTTIVFYTGYTDPSLSRDMPIGAYLIKKKGRLVYTVDGEKYDDFPILFYAIIGAWGASIFTFGIGISILLTYKKRAQATLKAPSSTLCKTR
jgi:hypothetical protein